MHRRTRQTDKQQSNQHIRWSPSSLHRIGGKHYRNVCTRLIPILCPQLLIQMFKGHQMLPRIFNPTTKHRYPMPRRCCANSDVLTVHRPPISDSLNSEDITVLLCSSCSIRLLAKPKILISVVQHIDLICLG